MASPRVPAFSASFIFIKEYNISALFVKAYLKIFNCNSPWQINLPACPLIYNQVEKLNCRNNCLYVGEGEIIFLFMAFQYSIFITMQLK